MEMYRSEPSASVASALGIYFLILAFADANIQQGVLRKPGPDGPYGLQSLTHYPMFVDEPRWILSPRTSTEDEHDDTFYVTRGRRRNLPRPPTIIDTEVRHLLDGEDEDSWTGRGKKGTLSNILENDPFWVNRGKRADVLQRTPIWMDAKNLEGDSNAFDEDRLGKSQEKRSEVGNMLSQDPYWANRGKRGDLTSALSSGDLFWVNRGKKDLQSVLEGGDKFWVNRGKKDLQSVLEGGDKFWVNRGKKDLQSVLEGRDKFWVNRGKKDLHSVLEGGDKFWVNRGKKDLQSLLEGGDKFWVNRGKKNDLQSVLNNGDTFWVNRGKKSDIQSLLNSKGDQFWVNRGKKNELQSMLNGGDPFWVNRGKRHELASLLKNGDQFWVNRGKKNELQSLFNNGDQFWVNRGKKNELQSVLNNGEQFWVNRGKKNELQSTLSHADTFWVNRGKKSELQTMLKGSDQFWVNRGKITGNENEFQRTNTDINNGQNSDSSNIRDKSDTSGLTFKSYLPPWSDSGWTDRLKKEPLKAILKPDPFFVNRGKKSLEKNKSEGNTNETQPRIKLDERTKREFLWEKNDEALTPLFQNAYWLDRDKKTNDRAENLDPFWVTRGKRAETHNRKRRDVAPSTTKPTLTSTLTPSQGSPRQKRMAKSPRMTFSYDKDYPYKKDSDVNSVVLVWKDKNAPGEQKDDGDAMGAGSPVLRQLGENIARAEPFWVSRGKKDASVDDDDFLEDLPEKRGDVMVSDVVSDLGALTQPGVTFWVARG